MVQVYEKSITTDSFGTKTIVVQYSDWLDDSQYTRTFTFDEGDWPENDQKFIDQLRKEANEGGAL